MDAYRLSGGKDLAPLGFNEIINNPKNILLVEWAGNIKNSLPGETEWIEFSHGKKASERSPGGAYDLHTPDRPCRG